MDREKFIQVSSTIRVLEKKLAWQALYGKAY